MGKGGEEGGKQAFAEWWQWLILELMVCLFFRIFSTFNVESTTFDHFPKEVPYISLSKNFPMDDYKIAQQKWFYSVIREQWTTFQLDNNLGILNGRHVFWMDNAWVFLICMHVSLIIIRFPLHLEKLNRSLSLACYTDTPVEFMKSFSYAQPGY